MPSLRQRKDTIERPASMQYNNYPISPEDNHLLRQRAAAAGLSVTSYVRTLIEADIATIRPGRKKK